MQLDLRTLFIVLLILYACLGFVCLLLPYRMPGSRAVTYWGYAMLALAAGVGGVALRGMVPDFISIVLANALIFGGFLLVSRSLLQRGEPRSNAFTWSVVGASILMIAYFTYVRPDRARAS